MRLREYGFVDDAKFAEGFATARKEVFGAARVIRDLRQRRVSAPVAEKAVGAAFENVDETEAITSWLERKLRGKNIPEFLSQEKNLASVYRKLRYAGFRSGPAISVLKRYASRAGELEDLAD
jgi:SOS response regulatory protein OraA/RecX